MADRTCPTCGESLHNASVSADDSVTCPACGTRVDGPPPGVAVPPPMPMGATYAVPGSPNTGSKAMAITALVLGILSLVVPCVGILLAIVAIVLGIIVLVKKRAGKGMAIGGLVCGGLGLIVVPMMLAILLPALAKARELSRQVACMANLRAIGQASDMYTVTYSGQYAPDLHVLVAGGGIEDKHLTCPSAGTIAGAGVDYVYVAPPPTGTGFGRPRVILACDLETNHYFEGRAVLWSDGAVEFTRDEATFQATLASPQNAAFAAALRAAEGP